MQLINMAFDIIPLRSTFIFRGEHYCKLTNATAELLPNRAFEFFPPERTVQVYGVDYSEPSPSESIPTPVPPMEETPKEPLGFGSFGTPTAEPVATEKEPFSGGGGGEAGGGGATADWGSEEPTASSID